MPFDRQNKSKPPKKRIAPSRDKKLIDERPRILGQEEKRSLILAHAANRAPVDHAQKFSLWAGITICVLVIGAGWLYSVRQTIAEGFNPGNEQVQGIDSDSQEAWQRYQIKQDLRDSAERMLKEIEKIEDTQLDGGFGNMIEKSIEAASEISKTTSTGSIEEKRTTLFKLLTTSSSSEEISDSSESDFALPPGVIKDNQ